MNGTKGHDFAGINGCMGHVIVALDVVEVDRLSNALSLIKVLEIPEEVRVIDDSPKIALEMAVIDGVEPDQRDEQTPVSLDKGWSQEIATAGQTGFETIECLE